MAQKFITNRLKELKLGVPDYTDNDTVLEVTSGRIGIGTTNATAELDVVGDIRIRGGIYDSNNNIGTTTSVLISTGIGVSWTPISQAALQGVQGIQGVQGGSGISTVKPNEGLTLDNQGVLGTIYNTLIDDVVTSVAVGGASSAPASTWKTKNIVEVLDTILFPDILPTYIIPTIITTSTITGTREIGEPISPIITTVGSENDAGAFTQIRTRRNSTTINTNSSPTQTGITSLAPQFGYPNPNNPNFSYTSVYTDNFTVVSGATTWNAQGDYNAGLPKNDNKGVLDPRTPLVRSVNAPQASSTNFASSTVTVTGIYPYFWGVSLTDLTASDVATLIAAGSGTKVLASSTGTVTITFNASSQYVWVAIPSTSTVKTTWFNTALNQGSIGPGQFILSPVSQNVNSPNSYWSAVSYRIYISGYASTTSGAIEFRN